MSIPGECTAANIRKRSCLLIEIGDLRDNDLSAAVTASVEMLLELLGERANYGRHHQGVLDGQIAAVCMWSHGSALEHECKIGLTP